MKKSISKLASNPRRKIGLIVILAFALIGALLLRQSFAATGLYLTGPTSVQKNTEFDVALKITTEVAIDGVEATLTYDQTKLQFVSIDDTGSAMPITLQQSGGSGNVTIIRGKLDGPASGDLSIASVRFKALAGSKSTAINLSGNATSGGTYTNPGATGMSISLTTTKSGSGGRGKNK